VLVLVFLALRRFGGAVLDMFSKAGNLMFELYAASCI